MSEPKCQVFERRVYDGAPTGGLYCIDAIRFRQFESQSSFRRVRVSDLEQYESGCHLHRRCFGHMCVTPNGITLPPQSMSMRVMNIATEYHTASRRAFANDYSTYIEKLKSTNYTKHGTMRCIMSTPIAGSGRLIATPQWELGPGCIAISPNLASRMRVCRKVYSEDGSESGSFVEGPLRENDWVIVVRPPSLHFGNTQPMRVKFWSADCVGIHPGTFSIFHGDFDGDEVHIKPVYDQGSIAECESWRILPFSKFDAGRRLFNSVPSKLKEKSADETLSVPVSDLRSGVETEIKCDSDRAEFIEYTTLSAKQIRDAPVKLAFGEYSRNKYVHIAGMSERFSSPSTERSFVRESIRGTEDVRRQQLSQGSLGDMTRVAKIAASCFYRPSSGSLHVATRTGAKVLVKDNIRDPGTPSVRAIANLCAVAQQAALDSHRAEAKDPTSHDFISDLILGCDTKARSSTADLTFVCFDITRSDSQIADICRPEWKHRIKDGVATLCKPNNIVPGAFKFITACYNPIVLRGVSMCGKDIVPVCKSGIEVVCKYYSVAMSPVEIADAAAVFSYNIEASPLPITTRGGMTARDLGWVETLLATDYTKLPALESDFEYPNTTTGAMMMSNFNYLASKHYLDEQL